MLGNYLDKDRYAPKSLNYIKILNFKDSFYFTKAEPGKPIPLVFGKARLEGKIIWLHKISNKEEINTKTKIFKKTNTTVNNSTKSYKYSISLAIAICEAKIESIGNVWYGDELISINDYKHRIYYGGDDQKPDPLILKLSSNHAPAFKDLAYIVFEELPLEDFDDSIPNFSFEVVRIPSVKQDTDLGNKIKSMVMIPGSGEYVYDTKVVYKQLYSPLNNALLYKKAINMHNDLGIADALCSLNQMEQTCPSIEWISLVVCWYGTDLDISECKILPAIEFPLGKYEISAEWKVGGFNRQNAKEISKNKNNIPNYGGTPSDESVINYILELKKRGKKIMFYPILLLDLENKPWRGRLTGSPSAMNSFFDEKYGYNDFIMHYAELVGEKVDAFIIGSELIGITKVRHNDSFPGVSKLASLAQNVKQKVANNVKISYAADWSEYHHTEGGWYNLDEIWGSKAIDFIGIDAYFPITNSEKSYITDSEIQYGFEHGEGYDYYIDEITNAHIPLKREYAWKNIQYWWENQHVNPNNKQTTWQPRSKPIWFTEFGFPSVDKASNQPNIFYDPQSEGGGFPRYSTGKTDIDIQKRLIKQFIDYWSAKPFIKNMFLWTWDARPYPAWPNLYIWADSYMWEKGHWVNNKIISTSSGSILYELALRSGLNMEQILVTDIAENIEGYQLRDQLSIKDAIDQLRIALFFDITSNQYGQIELLRRGKSDFNKVDDGELVAEENQSSYLNLTTVPINEILGKIDFYFSNINKDYEIDYINASLEQSQNMVNEKIYLPISITANQAYALCNLIIANAWHENMIINFTLPTDYLNIKVGALICLEVSENEEKSTLKTNYNLRIINIKYKDYLIYVSGILDDINSYNLDLYKANEAMNEMVVNQSQFFKKTGEEFFSILQLDFLSDMLEKNEPCFYAYYYNDLNKSRKLHGKLSTESNWENYKRIEARSLIGKVINYTHAENLNPIFFDQLSKIYVNCNEPLEESNSNWHIAKFGNELIKFKHCKSLKNHGKSVYSYEISHLSRGEFGTKSAIHNHQSDEYFILLDAGYSAVNIDISNNKNLEFDFKIGNKLVANLNYIKDPKIDFTHKITELSNGCIQIDLLLIDHNQDNWLKSSLDENKSYEININFNDKTKTFISKSPMAIIDNTETELIAFLKQENLSNQFLSLNFIKH